MGEIPKWLQRLIGRLIPTQTSSGDGGVQIGKMDGDVTNVHLTQHIYATPTPPPSPPPSKRVRATSEQGQVLALLRQVPDEVVVLDFVEREFGTRYVKHLTPQQCYRVRRYVEVILTKLGTKQ